MKSAILDYYEKNSLSIGEIVKIFDLNLNAVYQDQLDSFPDGGKRKINLESLENLVGKLSGSWI